MWVRMLQGDHLRTLGGGRGRAAPPTVARPAGPRLRAGILLVATLGAMAWMFGRPVPPPAEPLRATPFAPGPLAGVGVDGRATMVPPGGPAVILYVDDRCRFCAEEVAAWHAAAGLAPPPGLHVIRARRGGGADLNIVPTSWASVVVVDEGGTIADALGVSAVPFLAVLDAEGSVVEASLGVTSPERIQTLIATLSHANGGQPND